MSDLISREVAIDALAESKEMISAVLDSLTLDYNSRVDLEQRRGQIDEDIETIKELLSVQPEQKHGHWTIERVQEYELSNGSQIYVPIYRCSNCGNWYESYVRGDKPIMPEDADFPDFCELCGARMEAE